MNHYLTEAIKEKFRCDVSAYEFLHTIMLDATVYLFGGAVRDLLDGKLDSSRDIDFVIDANTTDSLDIERYLQPLNNIEYKKNRYDGYKICFNNELTVDIWNLKDTWAFRTNKLMPSAANLMRSVYLNIDALVYSLNSNSFLDNCNDRYRDIIKKSLLDIVFVETPFEDLNLLRALVFKKKYSLELSSELRCRLLNYVENDWVSRIDSLLNLQITHYNQILLDKTDLNHMFQHMQ